MGSQILELIFHAEAFAFDEDGLGMMGQTVQECGSQGCVAIEDFSPAFLRLVGGDDDGVSFVTVADDLEEKITANNTLETRLLERALAND